MSNKIFMCVLGFALALVGCRKETASVFGKTPDERLDAALSAYQQKLSQPPGWKVFVYPKGLTAQGIDVGGFTYYMKFTDSNRVTMVSDFDSVMAATPKESGFRLKAVQRPSIYFDTYSYLHVLADPTFIINNSPASINGPMYENGYGWGTDFDFAFADNAPSDTIHLKGNFNGSEAVMLKATQAEMDAAFKSGKLRAIKDSTTNYLNRSPYIYIPAASNSGIVLSFDLYLRRVTFYYITPSGNIAPPFDEPYSITVNGIYFKAPVSIGGYTFQEMLWDNSRGLYYIVSGGRRIDLVSTSSPILSLSLPSLLGVYFTTISVPPQPLASQSATFVSKLNTVKANVKSGPYNMELTYLEFVFDVTNKRMNLNVYAFPGTNLLTAQFTYSYTMDNAGYFKFTRVTQNEYGRQLDASMRPLLDYIEGDTFQLNGLLTSTAILGQFASREHTDFSFTGYLN